MIPPGYILKTVYKGFVFNMRLDCVFLLKIL